MKAWVIIGLFVAGAVWAWRIWEWRRVMNERTWKAEHYLEEPVLRGPDGREYNRKQLIDALIANAVQQKK